MSPVPSRVSAPVWSRMVRESILRRDLEARCATGKLALMRPVMTSTDGRCVARIRWMPAARAFWAMRATEVSTSLGAHHHQVGELVDDDDDVGQLARRLVRGRGLRGLRLAAAAPTRSSSLASRRRRCRRVAVGAVAARDLGVGVELDLLLAAVGAGDDDADASSRERRRGLAPPRPCRRGAPRASRCSWRCRARRSWRAARSGAPSRRPPSAAPGWPSSDR